MGHWLRLSFWGFGWVFLIFGRLTETPTIHGSDFSEVHMAFDHDFRGKYIPPLRFICFHANGQH
jgi:hypothetical protein